MHEPGLVAVPCLELVYSVFALTLARLAQRLPAGSQIAFNTMSGGVDTKRNHLVQDWLLREPALQWVLFVDSDQRIPADVVDRLLAHNVSIVGTVISKKREAQVAVRPLADDLVPAPVPHLEALTSKENAITGAGDGRRSARLRLGGLQRVEAIGTGCLLVRREVFEQLPAPWFVADRDGPTEGTCEDFSFCDKARAAGFPIYCDTSLVVGHLTVVAMTPTVHGTLAREASTLGNGDIVAGTT